MDERGEVLQVFQSRIGVTFRHIPLLAAALTHSSFVNECPQVDLPDNQRLEFLGDAILDFLVGEWLYLRYPDASEGELTSIRARVVCTESLADFAREVDLGSCLRLGRGEAASGGHGRSANLCAGLEALVGAIYLDQGISVVRSWVCSLLERHAQEIDSQRKLRDAKSLLQEYTQGHLRIAPSYRIVGEKGPDHAKVFAAEVVLGDDVWGEGTGTSKQLAEQAAAAAALRRRRKSLKQVSQ